MSRKYFFKIQSSLQRKVIAGGLSAVFGAGMYGSYAGAAMQTEQLDLKDQEQVQQEFLKIIANKGMNIANTKNLKFGQDLGKRLSKAKNVKNDFKVSLDFLIKNWESIDKDLLSVDELLSKEYKLDDQQIYKLRGGLGNSFPEKGGIAFLAIVEFIDLNNENDLRDKVFGESFLKEVGFNVDGNVRSRMNYIMDTYYEDVVKKIEEIKKNTEKGRKIVKWSIAAGTFLVILAVVVIAAVKLNGKKGADNQNGNETGNQPDGTDPSNNNPEQTGDKDQQDTEQNNSDNTQVASNESSSSVLQTGLKISGAILGSVVPPAAIVTAARLSKNKKSTYLYLDEVKTDDFVIKGSNTTTNKSEPEKVVGKPSSAKKLDAAKGKKRTEVVK